MIFDLQVTVDDAIGVIVNEYKSVNIRWESYGDELHNGVAIDGENLIVSRIRTFDDYPIEIFDTKIVINGITNPDKKFGNSEYGSWILTLCPP